MHLIPHGGPDRRLIRFSTLAPTLIEGIWMGPWATWFAWYPIVTYNNHIRWFRTVKRRLAVFHSPYLVTYWQYSD